MTGLLTDIFFLVCITYYSVHFIREWRGAEEIWQIAQQATQENAELRTVIASVYKRITGYQDGRYVNRISIDEQHDNLASAVESISKNLGFATPDYVRDALAGVTETYRHDHQ
jgi:hypothetical protein